MGSARTTCAETTLRFASPRNFMFRTRSAVIIVEE